MTYKGRRDLRKVRRLWCRNDKWKNEKKKCKLSFAEIYNTFCEKQKHYTFTISYLLLTKFESRAVTCELRFFPSRLGHKSERKKQVRNLQYGPRKTR